MHEEFRCLGLNFSFKGVAILEKLVNDEIKVFCLSEEEISEVLAAWKTRNYVPVAKVETTINSKPQRIQGETEKQYKYRHVKNIVQILKNLKNTPCT